MRAWLREVLGRRPAWMNALLGFCAYMSFVYMPWDFFVKPVAVDEEVWFGFLLHGWAAKATEPLHWAIYAAGTYGFWRMRPWMWPWAGVYVAQITVATTIWLVLNVGGMRGGLLGAASAVVYGALTIALLRARDHFQPQRRSFRDRFGEWALVTGASSGIGAAFARALAREGHSIVLAARREDRLREVADALSREFGVATRVVPVDLATPAGAAKLAGAVADLEIGVLVNNAGFGHAGRFERAEEARLVEMIQVNCAAPLVLARRLVGPMRTRGRGALLFTGSLAAKQPMPLHATYAASKAFVALLGEALWAELRGSGVEVLVVEPGTTETEFQTVAGEIPHHGETPERVVEVALAALGAQPSVGVGWWRWLRGNLGMRLLPRSLLASVAHAVIERQTPSALR
ncbi:MAG: SDR family oxidoreductase [Myxococcota bacterium]|nr:SDR family oxidoreductase [Myxococcota bacterium]